MSQQLLGEGGGGEVGKGEGGCEVAEHLCHITLSQEVLSDMLASMPNL